MRTLVKVESEIEETRKKLSDLLSERESVKFREYEKKRQVRELDAEAKYKRDIPLLFLICEGWSLGELAPMVGKSVSTVQQRAFSAWHHYFPEHERRFRYGGPIWNLREHPPLFASWIGESAKEFLQGSGYAKAEPESPALTSPQTNKYHES